MLGQHLYIEPDYGQGEVEEKEGLWLYDYYIVQDDGDPYVWAADKKNRLEKRKVELGEHDENLGEYEIKSGLSEDDLIAFPMQGLYEGVAAVTNMEEVDYSSPLYNQESTDDSGMDEECMMKPELNLWMKACIILTEPNTWTKECMMKPELNLQIAASQVRQIRRWLNDSESAAYL